MPGAQVPFAFGLSQRRLQAQPASASAFPSTPLRTCLPVSTLSGMESSLTKFHGSGLDTPGTPGQPVLSGQCVRVFYFALFCSDGATLYSPGWLETHNPPASAYWVLGWQMGIC